MSDEHFLTRWSRKKGEAKREAAEQAGKPAAAEEAAHEQESAAAPTAPAAPSEQEKQKAPQVDLASLPSIESIGAGSDIRAFMQAGVPAELTRAALRRAWTSDPTIRDFIGIAENQWDFASAEGVPGFGPLKAIDDVRRMVAEITGELGKADEPSAKSAPSETAESTQELPESEDRIDAAGEAKRQDIARLEEDKSSAAAGQEAASHSIVQRNESTAATQHKSDEEEYKSLPTRRSHGRALPE